MRKAERQEIINDLYNTGFYNFNYKEYYRLKEKLGDKIKDKDIQEAIKRIESHPTWNKSKAEHREYCKEIDRKERKEYNEKMRYDAIHGNHYKYINVFFGKIKIDPDYEKILEELNIPINLIGDQL